MNKRVDDLFYGSVTVGERGQIVIPSEARADLGIRPGDKLLVIRSPLKHGLMVSKIEDMADMVEMMKEQLQAAVAEADDPQEAS